MAFADSFIIRFSTEVAESLSHTTVIDFHPSTPYLIPMYISFIVLLTLLDLLFTSINFKNTYNCIRLKIYINIQYFIARIL